jgi:hypothetical protein
MIGLMVETDPKTTKSYRYGSTTSAADPCHFDVDPDSGIQASDQRIRILLFSSLTLNVLSSEMDQAVK